jgi:ubiquinone/menaquinone biosynthesis C-methylase UbiE
MKADFDKHRDLWGPLFTSKLDFWAKTVFESSLPFIRNKQLILEEKGVFPTPVKPSKAPLLFPANDISIEVLKDLPADYNRVKYFDYAAHEYEMATHRFKKPIVEETLQLIAPLMFPDTQLLDVGCGPGYESIALAQMIPGGEIVALDLSLEMIRLAYHNALQHEMHNMYFIQADVQELPEKLNGCFDIVYCQLSCGYFKHIPTVATMFYKALADDGGQVILIEPYNTLMNSLSIDDLKAANPYFEQIFSREDLREIFLEAGFNAFYWKEILPGIGVSIISKYNDL